MNSGDKMFSELAKEKLKYYVYSLSDPRNGEIFYIGKGINNRVFEHELEVLSNSNEKDKILRINGI